ncbi:MAG TPA: hypothetical protein PLR99_03665 [Polyangiaceae bacterium]|nr:hypothetical protein [Polyangiaceae bacterium]
MSLAFVALMATCLGWGILCGAIVYEHLAVIPVWTKKAPESLTMWRGAHRIRPERFWMGIHPVLLALLLTCIALTWSQLAVRHHLLAVAAGYALVIATTAVYYVPELMRVTRDPDAPIPVPEWDTRAKRWAMLCVPRSVLVVVLALPLFRALTLL